MSEKKQGKFYQAIGRRKEATTPVRLFAGKGESTVNGTPVSKYFPIDSFQAKLVLPYRATGTEDKFYFVARAEGGGKVGQLEALVLFKGDPRKPLRDAGLMTRNPREKERKKYFLKKARKRPQYSKR